MKRDITDLEGQVLVRITREFGRGDWLKFYFENGGFLCVEAPTAFDEDGNHFSLDGVKEERKK